MTRIYEAFMGWVAGIIFPDSMFEEINWTNDFDEEL